MIIKEIVTVTYCDITHVRLLLRVIGKEDEAFHIGDIVVPNQDSSKSKVSKYVDDETQISQLVTVDFWHVGHVVREIVA